MLPDSLIRFLSIGLCLGLGLLGPDLGILVATPKLSEDDGRLSIQEALRAAESASLSAQRAKLEAELAMTEERLLDRENDPRLTLSAGFARFYPGAGTGGNAAIFREQSYVATLTSPLYDFGRHGLRMAELRAKIEAKKMGEGEVRELVRYQTARAYSAWVAEEQVLALITSQLKVAETKWIAVAKNVRQGLRSSIDGVTAEVDYERAKMTLLRAQNGVQRSKMRLGLLMGLSGEAGQHPNVRLPEALGTWPELDRLDQLLKEWLKASRRSLGVERRAQEMESLKHSESLISATKMPTLNGQINAQRFGPWVGGLRTVASGGVTLAWDIPWNGMSRDERLQVSLKRQALELEETEDHQKRTERELLARDLYQALKVERLQLGRQLALHERQLDLERQRYEAGQISATELSTQEQTLLNVRLEFLRLTHALMTPLLDLAEARGVLALEALFL